MNAGDDVHIEVVDSREAALLIHVDMSGKTRMTSTLAVEQIPKVLRQLADQYEARHG